VEQLRTGMTSLENQYTTATRESNDILCQYKESECRKRLEAEESRALSAAVAKREQAEIDARKAECAKKNAKSDVEAAM
jgi:hypothetical protein